jgi:hypothetical protein
MSSLVPLNSPSLALLVVACGEHTWCFVDFL